MTEVIFIYILFQTQLCPNFISLFFNFGCVGFLFSFSRNSITIHRKTLHFSFALEDCIMICSQLCKMLVNLLAFVSASSPDCFNLSVLVMMHCVGIQWRPKEKLGPRMSRKMDVTLSSWQSHSCIFLPRLQGCRSSGVLLLYPFTQHPIRSRGSWAA